MAGAESGRDEAVAAKYAADGPAWGYRKIAAMMRADGHQVSTSTVQRALRRRGLLLPTGFRADRRSWARLRKRVFRDPPRQRNRVWQMDFSEFETARGGIWRICAVIDYPTKYCLAATPTSRGQDALGCLRRAVVEAERVLDLDDLRADRGVMDVVDADDYVIGEAPAPIAVVTDNGPCFRGVTFADAFAGDDPLFRHVRTRVRSPETMRVDWRLLLGPWVLDDTRRLGGGSRRPCPRLGLAVECPRRRPGPAASLDSSVVLTPTHACVPPGHRSPTVGRWSSCSAGSIATTTPWRPAWSTRPAAAWPRPASQHPSRSPPAGELVARHGPVGRVGIEVAPTSAPPGPLPG